MAVGDAGYGPYVVTVIDTDGTNAAEATFQWTVSDAITLAVPSDQTNNEGATVSPCLSVPQIQTAAATLSYRALAYRRAAINPSTGAISGTMAVGAAPMDPYYVTVVAQDGISSTSQSFTWNVNNPITLPVSVDQTNTEGDSVSLSFSATDANSGATLSYSVVGLPMGLHMNSSTGVITGVVAPVFYFWPYSVVVIVSDGTNSTAQGFTWNVNNPISITLPTQQTFIPRGSP